MKYYNVGKVINTHGIRGEVKVATVTDFPRQRFQVGNVLYLKLDNGRHKVVLDHVRRQMTLFLLHFKGYNSIDAVKFMKQRTLQISSAEQNAAQDLRPGQYYVHQILGLKVVDSDGRQLGVISQIMKTGANDVWVVNRPGKGELLLPKIPQVIKNVNLASGVVTVELMKGMGSDED